MEEGGACEHLGLHGVAKRAVVLKGLVVRRQAKGVPHDGLRVRKVTLYHRSTQTANTSIASVEGVVQRACAQQ